MGGRWSTPVVRGERRVLRQAGRRPSLGQGWRVWVRPSPAPAPLTRVQLVGRWLAARREVCAANPLPNPRRQSREQSVGDARLVADAAGRPAAWAARDPPRTLPGPAYPPSAGRGVGAGSRRAQVAEHPRSERLSLGLHPADVKDGATGGPGPSNACRPRRQRGRAPREWRLWGAGGTAARFRWRVTKAILI